MTFYHLHHTELRINLMKHRHRISSFVVLIVRNKKLVVNVFARENYFYFKNGVLVQSPLASPGSLFAACSPPSVNASVFTSSRILLTSITCRYSESDETDSLRINLVALFRHLPGACPHHSICGDRWPAPPCH